VRVVQGLEGSVEVDLSGSRGGRGAYFCHKPQCWTEAIKRDRLGIALRSSITQKTKSDLLAALQAHLNSRATQEE